MADWPKLAVVMFVIGFALDVFGIAIYQFTGEKGAVEAMEICGFIFYIVALALLLLIVFGELSENRAAAIAQVSFSFAATLFLVIGLAIYGDRVAQPSPYAATLIVVSALLSLLSGICIILTVYRDW